MILRAAPNQACYGGETSSDNDPGKTAFWPHMVIRVSNHDVFVGVWEDGMGPCVNGSYVAKPDNWLIIFI